MTYYRTSADALAAAKALAAKRGEVAHVFIFGVGDYEVLSDSAVEHAFAAGDLTESEYDSAILATVRP